MQSAPLRQSQIDWAYKDILFSFRAKCVKKDVKIARQLLVRSGGAGTSGSLPSCIQRHLACPCHHLVCLLNCLSLQSLFESLPIDDRRPFLFVWCRHPVAWQSVRRHLPHQSLAFQVRTNSGHMGLVFDCLRLIVSQRKVGLGCSEQVSER